jgi:hypothetical protein
MVEGKIEVTAEEFAIWEETVLSAPKSYPFGGDGGESRSRYPTGFWANKVANKGVYSGFGSMETSVFPSIVIFLKTSWTRASLC